MTTTNTEVLAADAAGIARAAQLLRAGACVAFPTETVYGLGARADDDAAIAGIYAAKGRPSFNPLIVHVASVEAASRIAAFSDEAERLAWAFWPGPLTLVLPLRPDARIAPRVTAGLGTVAVRVPESPAAASLLEVVGLPLAAPSANPSGSVSPTRADHVVAGLGGRIAAVIDGGPCSVGLESTIVGFAGGPRLLRPGGLPVEAIEVCLGAPLTARADDERVSAPGQLVTHYAPVAGLRLNVQSPEADDAFLGFGAVPCDLNLSASGDLTEAAANLFDHLRALDARGVKTIAVSPIPETGLGRAINDRLRRAAAPRG